MRLGRNRGRDDHRGFDLRDRDRRDYDRRRDYDYDQRRDRVDRYSFDPRDLDCRDYDRGRGMDDRPQHRITKTGTKALYSCSNLEEYVTPPGIEVDRGAFYECTKLRAGSRTPRGSSN